MSTVRPVRRVDAEGSQRASEDFVGTIRDKSESPVAATSSSSKKHNRTGSKEPLTTKGQAGKALVDEVVMPVIQRVSPLLHLSNYPFVPPSKRYKGLTSSAFCLSSCSPSTATCLPTLSKLSK